MKKRFLFFALPVLALLTVVGCEKKNELEDVTDEPQEVTSEDQEITEIKGTFLSNSKCKSDALRSTAKDSTAKFTYDESKKELTFTAMNRMFSCGSSNFQTDIRADNEDIFIQLSAQDYIIGENGEIIQSNCICRYDITSLITGVEKKKYTIHVTGVNGGAYEVDLTQYTEGAFGVE